MDVAGGQKLLATGIKPMSSRIGLTFWAMPISARIKGRGAITAVGTLIHVPAQNGSTTVLDGTQHFQVLSREPVAVLLEESLSGYVNDVGQFP
jgi:hypothetical protein